MSAAIVSLRDRTIRQIGGKVEPDEVVPASDVAVEALYVAFCT